MQNFDENIMESFNYSVNNGFIDLDLVKNLIFDEINKMDLSNNIKDLEFILESNETIIKNKTIYFGIKSLANLLDKKESLNNKSVIMIYRYLLEELYGELNSIQQRKIIRYYDKYKDELLPSEKLEIEKYALIMKYARGYSYHVYKKAFDLLPTEHESRYIGYYKALTKVQELIPNFDELFDSEKINKEIVDELTKGYILTEDKVISPYERLPLFGLDSKKRKELSRTNSFNNYKKLILGLPVDRYVVNDLRTDMRLRENEFYKNIRII